MNLEWLEQEKLTEEEFSQQIILPAYYPIAEHGNMRFSIQNQDEKLIICSSDYARARGLEGFKDAIFKFPEKDYRRFGSAGSFEFNIVMEYLRAHRKSSSYIYKEESCGALFMTVCEPVINFFGEVIGRKDTVADFELTSHRSLIEQHFKRFSVSVASLVNVSRVDLTEREEIVLFMLIGGYSQQEIAQLIGVSRGMVHKIIAEKLCVKFELSLVSTKLLVETAISCGFANFIPESFLVALNS